jgi:hypothetical protein
MLDLLVLDKDFDYCKNLLKGICSKNKNVRISCIANDMQETLTNPDIIIANYEFLEHFSSSNSNIIYIDDCVTQTRIGNSLIIPKNNFSLILNQIEQYANNTFNLKLEKIISSELQFLDFDFSHVGTICLLESIKLLYINTNNYIKNLEKNIYPIISKKYNLSPTTVKSNIAYATNRMLDECDKSKLCKYLGYNISKRPGAKSIMCAILENIKHKI